MNDKAIFVKGARVNNLKNIDLEIPRNALVVITGLSGSGKSSLAFDTLYAEGQRRYVESLSAYARQFLGRMHKPDCDYIKGLPPAIAIEQRVISRNPRSTVGTSTEIYDYLRLLFARIGHTFSPISGQEVKQHSVDDIISQTLTFSEGTRFTVLARFAEREDRSFSEQLEIYLKQGITRLDADGTMVHIEDVLEERNTDTTASFSIDELKQLSREEKLFLLIDRMSVSHEKEALSRLTDSVETALYEGHGECFLRLYPARTLMAFSTRFEADGIEFEKPNDNMFSFNSPLGACPECEGFGNVIGIDEHLVVPDETLSVYDGAVVCWRGEKMGEWRTEFCRRASRTGFPIFKPYCELTREEKNLLWHGDADERSLPSEEQVTIDAFFDYVRRNQYKIQYRVMLARYRGKTVCPKCHGTRLKGEASYVRVGSKSIQQLVDLPISELRTFFDEMELPGHEAQLAKRLLTEIRNRLRFLCDVGLGYLTLNRASNTLSGGESQRISLSTSLGSSLVGSLYILDEPSIGLHSRDTAQLISVMKSLRDLGNTVVVVEHDEDIMRAADYVIDIGPEAGRLGGEIVLQGSLEEIRKLSLENIEKSRSHTAKYLRGIETIAIPSGRRHWNRSITIKGARQNNLKNIDVKFPLNVLTVVTGVSGSGKSTLVRDIFYNALCRQLDMSSERPGSFSSLSGDVDSIKAVEFVNQSPIGKSSRSNPVTYVKAYDEIRKLMAEQPLAKQLDFTAAYFSFNTEGGRCEECKGEGKVKVEMQFMADLELTCEACGGYRFNKQVLDVRYEGRNIYDILEMTVNEAIQFFLNHGKKRIAQLLQPLQDVGLGYIKLGQPSNTLSGGESQRIKLAYYLGKDTQESTLFIFDEPTTGLHATDISKLLSSLNSLIERGHSVIIVEHNLDIIKCADYIIDLGPEGGKQGGYVVAMGTPEEVAATAKGYTARFLKKKL